MIRLFLALFFFPLTLLGQTFPVDGQTGKIFFSEEVLVKDASQSDLFARAKSWFENSAKNKQGWLKEDTANGLITGRAFTLIAVSAGKKIRTYQLWYTATIRVEDDLYGYYLSDFLLQPVPTPSLPTATEPSARKEPLEAVMLPKKMEGNDITRKKLSAKAEESILALLAELKAHLLSGGVR